MPTGAKVIAWIIGLFLAIVIITAITPFTVISTGDVGVVLNLGKVDRVLNPGMHWITPLVEDVQTLNVNILKEQVNASASSKDMQSVNAVIAVQYKIDETRAAEIWTKFRGDQKSVAIDPAVQEAVKSATSKYTAEELITKRDQVSRDVFANLKESLATSDILVSVVSIVDFNFSPTFNQAIEAKVTAEQNALAEKNNLAASQFKAQAIRVTSEAANNEKYIELQRLEVERAAITKWDGHLPQQFIPGSALPFINLKSNN